MREQINEAIQLLQSTASMSAEDSVSPVTSAIELLVVALKDPKGTDIDKGDKP